MVAQAAEPYYRDDPWNVPVPVQPGGFLALHAAHAELDVCTDLAAIRPYDVPHDPQADELLYADMQVGPGENVVLRLGSGRSGFCRGKYLKGVGRTQLAGNWVDANDSYHSTGHMFASSAIREYVVSSYLLAKGAQHLIVPCEGILVRKLDRELKVGIELFESKQSCSLPQADRHLQAISVKPANFARYSNINWLLGCVGPSPDGIAAMAYLLQAYSQGPNYPRPTMDECTPSSVVGALADAVQRGLDAFMAYFRLGVYWGSYYNNFAIDGRFLDLEVPIIYGAPFVGCFAHHRKPEIERDPSNDAFVAVGVEVFDYVAHVLGCIDSMISRLAFLADMSRESSTSEFLRALINELKSVFSPSHPLRDRGVLCNLVIGLLKEAGASPRKIRRYVESEYDECFSFEQQSKLTTNLRRKPGHTARPEPIIYSTAYEAIDLCDGAPTLQADEESEYVNNLISHLDSLVDPEQLLAELADLDGNLQQNIKPAPEDAFRTLDITSVEKE